MAWTHLHPNAFMELLSNMMPVRDGAFPVFWGDRRVGWVAVRTSPPWRRRCCGKARRGTAARTTG